MSDMHAEYMQTPPASSLSHLPPPRAARLQEWNRALSDERARSVARALQECGVETARVETVGHGPSKPLEPDYSRRRRNRRVEFLVL